MNFLVTKPNRFLILFFVSVNMLFSQVPVRDRWDTLYADVDYSNTASYLYNKANVPFNNHMLILSDSTDNTNFYPASYLQFYNTSNNTLSTINYTRLPIDFGTKSGAAITTNTANLNYFYFGALSYGSSNMVDNFGLYKYNSQTNAVTSETVALPSEYHHGVLNVGFFSPNSNHDSLLIFVSAKLLSDDSVYIYKKHYNQSGMINSHIKLPQKLNYISKIFIFNNVLYVCGYNYNISSSFMFRSTDGLTFSEVTNYTASYYYEEVTDVDTLNNKLYLGINDNGGGSFKILETSDGLNFTLLVNSQNNQTITSLKTHNKTIWYAHRYNGGSKAYDPTQYVMFNDHKPNVSYLDLSTNTEILSIDTLGRPFNRGEAFKIQTINNKLLLAGNYYDEDANSTPGTFVYEFIPPVANFTISSNNWCLSSPYTLINQSINTDSVRWIKDNNFYAGIGNNYNAVFSTTGNHQVGLIAISGTQKDTLKYTINVYSVSVSVSAPSSICLNYPNSFASTVNGAMGQVTYTVDAPGLNGSSTANGNIVLTASTTGNYSYEVSIKDVNNCSNTSPTYTVNVLPNKDFTGVVTAATLPVAGEVTLYKYEPILTKFDSIATQTLNALGEYTFSLQNANTYIIKCTPTDNSLQVTYAPNETGWKNAVTIPHGCINNTTQNINVIPLTNIGTGPGVLSGKVVEGIGYGQRSNGSLAPGNPIKGLNIKAGRNPGGDVVAQSRTNSSGEYTITGLPVDVAGQSYFLYVDIPGLDTNGTYHRAIITGSIQYTELDFVVDSAFIKPTLDLTGISEYNINDVSVLVFPNPSTGKVNIQFGISKPELIEATLIDISGRKISQIIPPSFYIEKDIRITKTFNSIEPGIYFVEIKIGEIVKTIKLIFTQ